MLASRAFLSASSSSTIAARSSSSSFCAESVASRSSAVSFSERDSLLRSALIRSRISLCRSCSSESLVTSFFCPFQAPALWTRPMPAHRFAASISSRDMSSSSASLPSSLRVSASNVSPASRSACHANILRLAALPAISTISAGVAKLKRERRPLETFRPALRANSLGGLGRFF